MILVQLVLLKVALDNRPVDLPYAAAAAAASASSGAGGRRPYSFWQWRRRRPYWAFLAYFVLVLAAIHLLLPPVARSPVFVALLGYAGLAVEAVLPLPQIISNQRARSCRGFRLSLLASWLLGDALKLGYFFFGADPVPLAFRLCAVFQCLCDCYLGLQYYSF